MYDEKVSRYPFPAGHRKRQAIITFYPVAGLWSEFSDPLPASGASLRIGVIRLISCAEMEIPFLAVTCFHFARRGAMVFKGIF